MCRVRGVGLEYDRLGTSNVGLGAAPARSTSASPLSEMTVAAIERFTVWYHSTYATTESQEYFSCGILKL